MRWEQHKKKTIVSVVFALFVVTGTYNAVVINSESLISSTDVRFVKRLDEIYGVTKTGNRNTASVQWQKIPTISSAPIRTANRFQPQPSNSSGDGFSNFASEVVIPAAAVQESLSLTLNEVVNPKRWPSGLPNGQFSGTLSTNNGVIEGLNVSLPNGEGVAVSFSEMSGNVFEYDLNNEVYSGMMYQVDRNSYMVTLTNGPLEGTRLRFLGEPSQDEKDVIEAQVAESASQAIGNTEGNLPEINDQQAQQMGQSEQIASAAPAEPNSTEAISYGSVEPQAEVAETIQAEEAPQELQAQNDNSEAAM
jgi:hypothetical protein